MPYRAERGILTVSRGDMNRKISGPSRGGDRKENAHCNHHAEDAKCYDAQEGRQLDGALQLELPECVQLAT